MNRVFSNFKFIFLAVIFFTAASAGAKDFSSWRTYSQGVLVSETTSFAPGTSGVLGFKIKLIKGWHTYWVNPGDSGSAINITVKNPDGAKVKTIHHPYPERLETGPLISFGYSDEVLLPMDIEVAKSARVGSRLDFEMDIEWLICEDACIPAFDTFKISVPVTALSEVKPSDEFALFQKTRAMVPALSQDNVKFEASDSGNQKLDLSKIQTNNEFVDFYPFKGSGVSNGKAEVSSVKPLILNFKNSNVPRSSDSRVGILILRDPETKALRALEFGNSGWSFVGGGSDGQSLWWMLLSAFLGGLILNLMPCVFPILSIKMLSLLKTAKESASEVRRQNLAYAGGVLFSFLAVALTLSALRSAGQFVGWGFQLQSPIFLSLLIWLFFLLALNLLGAFEIEFLDANVGNKLTRIKGVWGSFFTGVLAVVVASPCTAPFMGVALGFGLSQSTWILVAVFLSLGLGLAAPYLVFVVAPGLAKHLPRPGAWMLRVRQVMAFPLLLTVIWLLWVLSQISGTNSLLGVISGCVALGFAVWLSSWVKHLARLAALVILAGSLLFVRVVEDPKPAMDKDWVAFSPEKLQSLKGQNIFINMTADWCLTCKVNEALVFSQPEVLELLKSKNVHLLKGDWTKRDEDITRFLNQYSRVGVPFYVLFSEAHRDGQILPEVLTKSSFMDWINREIPDKEVQK